MKNISCLIALLAAFLVPVQATLACSYQAFDLKVVKSGIGIKSTAPRAVETPLAFAKDVVSDGIMVQSDAPFINHAPGVTWTIDPTDSELSKQSTMLELYGYFKDFVFGKSKDPESDKIPDPEIKMPANFLTEGTMTGFKGLSIDYLMKYPNVPPEFKNKIDAAVNATWKDAGGGDKVLKRMSERNGGPGTFGVGYFSRPSFLSSNTIINKYGASTALACMALSYTVDRYTNPSTDARVLKAHEDMAMGVVRSSILDYFAAQAIEAKKKDREIAGITRPLGKEVSCEIKKTADYKLDLSSNLKFQTKCIKVVQSHPVVRRGPDGERLIQVGDQLFGVSCTFGGKEFEISKQKIDGLRFSEFLQALGDGLTVGSESDLGKSIKNKIPLLADPNPAKAKDFVTDTSKKCDALMTAAKADAKISAAPGRRHADEALVKSSDGPHGKRNAEPTL